MVKKKSHSKKEKPVSFFVQRDILGFEKFIAPVSFVTDRFNITKCLYDASMLPSLLRRVVALIIDLLVVMTVFFLVSMIFNQLGDVVTWLRASIFVFMWYLYDPLLTAYYTTLGQYVAGIKVRKFSDGSKRISLSMAIVRFIIKSPLGWISFLTIPFTNGRRALHDLVSGSIVLKK